MIPQAVMGTRRQPAQLTADRRHLPGTDQRGRAGESGPGVSGGVCTLPPHRHPVHVELGDDETRYWKQLWATDDVCYCIVAGFKGLERPGLVPCCRITCRRRRCGGWGEPARGVPKRFSCSSKLLTGLLSWTRKYMHTDISGIVHQEFWRVLLWCAR